MKQRFFFTTMVMLIAYLLSACGGASQTADEPAGDQAALKVRAVEVAFTGVVEAIKGNEWTVNGQVLSVDPAVVRDGPFRAGDTIKVEGKVNPDGSLSISRVEAPSAEDLTGLPQLGNDNANANSNDANANSNDANSNDSNANTNGNDSNTNDDNSNDGNANSNDANTNANANTNDDSNNANFNSNDDQDDSNGNANDDDGGSSGKNGNGGDDDSSKSGDDDDSGNSNGD